MWRFAVYIYCSAKGGSTMCVEPWGETLWICSANLKDWRIFPVCNPAVWGATNAPLSPQWGGHSITWPCPGRPLPLSQPSPCRLEPLNCSASVRIVPGIWTEVTSGFMYQPLLAGGGLGSITTDSGFRHFGASSGPPRDLSWLPSPAMALSRCLYASGDRYSPSPTRQMEERSGGPLEGLQWG